ncbi:MAG: hypothetical protein ACPL3B_08520, partial [Fervidobacterium sp.]
MTLELKGRIYAKLISPNGVEQMFYTPNVITTTGINNLIRKAVGQSSSQPSGAQFVAVGTGAGTISAGSTLLANEIDRISASYSEPGSAQWMEDAIFGPGRAIGTITEAGCFNSLNSGSGVMLAGQNLSVVKASA